ncbi:MAG: M50 family metallopeptidase [Actinomycetota bacterium]
MSVGVTIFIVALLVVIMIHEAGHFAMAKLFNFKATKFFLGFGPTIWSVQKGETEYGVKAIPAGGFVKIIGMNPYEEVAPEDRSRSYPNKPRWQRALLLVAGSATHWLVAFVFLAASVIAVGLPEATNRLATVEDRIEGRPTPASEAGFREGDEVVGVGGVRTESWERIREFIRAHPGEEVTFVVARDGETTTIPVRLGKLVEGEDGIAVEYAGPDEAVEVSEGEAVVGFLGVSTSQRMDSVGVGGAVSFATTTTWEFTAGSVRGIGSIFTTLFDGSLFEALSGEGAREPTEGPVGLIGAGRIAGQALEEGLLNLAQWIAGLTIFIGLMNLLPLPPLDGGHLAVVAYEAATGRTVDVRKLIPIAAAVISFFVILFLAVLYLDLVRPIEVPF